MTSQQLLLEGLNLMLLGMGTVFLFLVMLILCIRLMSSLLNRMIAPEPTAAVATTTVAAKGCCAQVDTDTLNAIQIAIKLHRSR